MVMYIQKARKYLEKFKRKLETIWKTIFSKLQKWPLMIDEYVDDDSENCLFEYSLLCETLMVWRIKANHNNAQFYN